MPLLAGTYWLYTVGSAVVSGEFATLTDVNLINLPGVTYVVPDEGASLGGAFFLNEVDSVNPAAGGQYSMTVEGSDTDGLYLFVTGTTNKYFLSNRADLSGVTQVIDGTSSENFACFAVGTSIATPRGPVAVEDLRIGDLVLTELDQTEAPIIWIGHRTVDCTRHPNPEKIWPVRVRAGAFRDRSPHRDLWLSPDHAVYVDDVLIPIKHLINGTSIAQMPVDEVTYYHVELPHHDVLFAEGLPCESYLDTGDRANFANGGGRIAPRPDFPALLWEARGCAPLIMTGPRLDAARKLVSTWGRPQERRASRSAARESLGDMPNAV